MSQMHPSQEPHAVEIPEHLRDFTPIELEDVIYRVGNACADLERQGVPNCRIEQFMGLFYEAEIIRRRANRLLKPEQKKMVYWFAVWSWPDADVFQPIFVCLTGAQADEFGLTL